MTDNSVPGIVYDDNDPADGGTWYYKPNWFVRTLGRLKWWWIIRNTSWYKTADGMRSHYIDDTRNFPRTVIVIADEESGVQIYNAETMERWWPNNV